jgi:hypothetical protein
VVGRHRIGIDGAALHTWPSRFLILDSGSPLGPFSRTISRTARRMARFADKVFKGPRSLLEQGEELRALILNRLMRPGTVGSDHVP